MSTAGGGARRLGIENIKDSMVGRAVLVDIAKFKGGELPKGSYTSQTPRDHTLSNPTQMQTSCR